MEALDAAWPHLEDDRLRSIYEGNVLPGSEQDQPRIDGSLHGYLIEKADNSYIRDFFCRHSRYYEILFHWESLDREAAIAAVRQHRTILEALLGRDRERPAPRWRRTSATAIPASRSNSAVRRLPRSDELPKKFLNQDTGPSRRPFQQARTFPEGAGDDITRSKVLPAAPGSSCPCG